MVNKVQDLCCDHLSSNYGENQATSLSDVLFYSQKEYIDRKGKIKKKKDETSAPVLYVKLIYSSVTKKFSTIFIVKGKKEVKPLDYIDKYFNTRMVITFDSIYLRKNSVSIQEKAHEVHILPFGEKHLFWNIKKMMMIMKKKMMMKLKANKKMMLKLKANKKMTNIMKMK